jgi:hypothetical protein
MRNLGRSGRGGRHRDPIRFEEVRRDAAAERRNRDDLTTYRTPLAVPLGGRGRSFAGFWIEGARLKSRARHGRPDRPAHSFRARWFMGAGPGPNNERRCIPLWGEAHQFSSRADPEIHGYLPITRAIFKGNKDIVRLYKSHGATCPSAQILGGEEWYRECVEIGQ